MMWRGVSPHSGMHRAYKLRWPPARSRLGPEIALGSRKWSYVKKDLSSDHAVRIKLAYSAIHEFDILHIDMSQTETISQESLVDLARAGSVRTLRAVQSGDGSWALVAAVGMNERTLRSQRESVRTWRSLDTLARYAREKIGINQFEVNGQ